MKITIDRVKIATFASEETLCFEARLLVDGVPIATAKNDGHGGATYFHSLTPAHRVQLDAVESFAKTLPPVECYGTSLDHDLEMLVGELVEDYEMDKKVTSSFRRNIKKSVLFVVNGELRHTKGKIDPTRMEANIAHIVKKYPQATILNSMSEAQALPVYRTHVVQA